MNILENKDICFIVKSCMRSLISLSCFSVEYHAKTGSCLAWISVKDGRRGSEKVTVSSQEQDICFTVQFLYRL